ncbi:MAG: hypothetical protein ACREBN_06270 [Burkholderiaceae bacterium]
MARKRSGQLTVLGNWARHLRPVLRRKFWKGERQAERVQLLDEAADVQVRIEGEETVPRAPKT